MTTPTTPGATGTTGTASTGGQPPTQPLAIDRTQCRGRGLCATLLPDAVTLDEWGYPVLQVRDVDPSDGETAVRMCPARALSWAQSLDRRTT